MLIRIIKALRILFAKQPKKNPFADNRPPKYVVIYYVTYDFFYTQHWNGGASHEAKGGIIIQLDNPVDNWSDIQSMKAYLGAMLQESNYPNPSIRINNFKEIKRCKINP